MIDRLNPPLSFLNEMAAQSRLVQLLKTTPVEILRDKVTSFLNAPRDASLEQLGFAKKKTTANKLVIREDEFFALCAFLIGEKEKGKEATLNEVAGFIGYSAHDDDVRRIAKFLPERIASLIARNPKTRTKLVRNRGV